MQTWEFLTCESSLEMARIESLKLNSSIRIHSRTPGLPLKEESRGTQTLCRIGLRMLQAIVQGSLLVVDELEASLHPSLARQIISMFNNPETNPRNAQLLFTTHDTNLLGTTLGEPALRRDQVWLTEKDPEGATVSYPLTDYQPAQGGES